MLQQTKLVSRARTQTWARPHRKRISMRTYPSPLPLISRPKAHTDLKLLVPIDLQCQTCPDPSTCARLLDEKWRQAYNACFRFGPAQPSMVYRYLRGLEGVTPPLALLHLSCQNHAKAFTTTREFLRYNDVKLNIMDSD